MKQDLRQALKERTLTGDGAMGTYLYQLGLPVGISYEELNITQPDVIADVHRRYYDAGARLIETNTYTANREKLSKFGLELDVAAINRAGVELARKAVGADAYVVGAVGSIRSGRRRVVINAQLEDDFREQMEALLEAGADGLLLETFYEHDELLAALRVARSLTNLPVICQFVTEDSGVTRDGIALDTAFAQLASEGADVVGFNCHSGPNGILRALEKLTPIPNVPFSVYPNAGLPKLVDGQYTYSAPPEYFASMSGRFAALGARIIGGCCGTTPEHIAAIAQALAGGAAAAPLQSTAAGTAAQQAEPVRAPAEQTAEIVRQPCVCGGEHDDELSLIELVKRRHTVIVEFDSPRGLSVEKFMKGSETLCDAGVDAISMADNSLAQTRMSNVSTGYLVKEKLGVRPLVHIACRDRNSIGMQSHLMGLHALDIDHVLAITGDPARVGDLPGASSVYDMTSFDLIRMTKQLNGGLAFSGKQLKEKAKFVVGSAFDPNVKYLEKAVQRMEKKIEAGADYFMTQPVYDPAIVEKLYTMTRHISAPIFIGIMPLISGRNAEYLHNEVPGIRITEAARSRMAGLEGEEGRRAGVEIAKELIDEVIRYFNGIYLMTPMMFSEMTAELTKYVWEKTGAKTITSCP